MIGEKAVFFLRDKVLRISNSRFWNYIAWNFYFDWSRHGEEWTRSEEWKTAMVEEKIYPNIHKDSSVLEIGPGGGKWSEFMAGKVKRLALVDMSPKCIRICRNRFKNCLNIDYHVNNGMDLRAISSESIDFIWSFDCFVHIDSRDAASYVKEFRRVLKIGGMGIIHHAMEKKNPARGWRSDINDKIFKKLLEDNNLLLVDQFDSWGKGKFNVDTEYVHDMISCFKKTAV